MALGAHTIKPGKRIKVSNKRVGRGNGSGKGTYSARGLKGQKSRSGGRGGLQLRGFKQSLQKVPKLRGFKSLKTKPQSVTLATIDRVCEAGETVTPYSLEAKGLVQFPDKGVKIVATGELTKKLDFVGVLATKKSVELIEKAGGTLKF